MATLQRGADGFYHPATEDEIRSLIEHAAQEGLKIRVRGSGHSVDAAIYTGDFPRPPDDSRDINIFLDKMRGLTFDDANMQVTAQAGCHLTADPTDPTGTSTVESGLFYQIDQKGWALPVTGGVSHQTVAGFISTGSSGGSYRHTVDRQIIGIRLIDGTGKICDLKRSDNPDDLFFAAGVSMGLLGIITAVTFQCVPRYDIQGIETTATYTTSEIDLFGAGNGKPSLQAFLSETEYTRVMWWPQPGVEKVVVWKAERLPVTPPDFKRKPYHEFPAILGTELPGQLLSALLFRLFGSVNPPEPSAGIGKLTASLLKRLYPLLLNGFLASGIKGVQRFQDTWWQGLPADNNVDYDLITTRFHEVWIPLSKTAEALAALRDHQRAKGFAATGTLPIEIKPTPRSDFWLNPAYHEDVIKMDTLWFTTNPGDLLVDYYPQFWELLRPFDYRLHWGKALSGDVAYLKSRYPRWDDFMALRQQMDPQQIFVTEYWRINMGIPAAS